MKDLIKIPSDLEEDDEYEDLEKGGRLEDEGAEFD
jgi:hypothetical protein